MTFEKWCATQGVYLNDSDDAAKAAKAMARRAWEAAAAAALEKSAAICDAAAAELRDLLASGVDDALRLAEAVEDLAAQIRGHNDKGNRA